MTDHSMSAASAPAATEEDLDTIRTIVKGSKIAMLTTMSSNGHHEARPLAVQEVDFDGELWFFTQDPSDKATDIRRHPQVGVSFQSGKGFLSMAGTAELLRDEALIEKFWSPSLEAWFPEGREDPTIALIRVRPETAEYWYSDEPGVVAAAKGVKAMLTGGHPDIGENRTVEL